MGNSFLSSITPVGVLIGAGLLSFDLLTDIGSFLIGLIGMKSNLDLIVLSFPSPIGGLLVISMGISVCIFLLGLIFNINPGGR